MDFVLIQSNQRSYSKEASLPYEAFALQIVQNRGLEISYPVRSGLRFCNRFRNALANALTTIVLPAFARSFFADGARK
ncbi:hypothetical protein D0C36_11325 [Mucilaginibacter conchicola]|uniref:Uncharacterized protein n=1 Tax=Mucilaginibacter conchicola TaxID=2303333 RepID=A0A372NT00_9SPHI|nr:hypothetical protein D0C36_11325 [Mucilaginibacter conchicola]